MGKTAFWGWARSRPFPDCLKTERVAPGHPLFFRGCQGRVTPEKAGKPAWRLFAQPTLDGIHQHAGDVHIEGGFNLANAGRAGDVNLGQPIADDVEADED